MKSEEENDQENQKVKSEEEKNDQKNKKVKSEEEKNDQENKKVKSEEGKSSQKKSYIKKTRLISKNQKKIEGDIMELKKTDKSDSQKKSQNDVSKSFKFLAQQYAGSLSVNFINIFSDLFSLYAYKKNILFIIFRV